MPFVERRHAEAESDAARDRFEGYLRPVPCPDCKGARLRPHVLAVTVNDRNIAQVVRAADRPGGRSGWAAWSCPSGTRTSRGAC